MSYKDEIDSLVLWFKGALNSVEPFQITPQQYREGTHSLPAYLRVICDNAFHIWLVHRHYELSYNQMCVAFFTAASLMKKFEIVSVGTRLL